MAGLQNSLNAPFPLSPAQGGSGVDAPTAHGILVGEGASAFNPIVLTAGEVLIGTTAGDPAAAAITGSGGITVLSTSGAINIDGSGAGITWHTITASTASMAVNSGYLCNNASNVTATLPATAALYSVIRVANINNAGGQFVIAQNASQYIQYGDITTTVGTGGSLTSTAQGDAVELLCVVANNGFQVMSSVGSQSYV